MWRQQIHRTKGSLENPLQFRDLTKLTESRMFLPLPDDCYITCDALIRLVRETEKRGRKVKVLRARES